MNARAQVSDRAMHKRSSLFWSNGISVQVDEKVLCVLPVIATKYFQTLN
jgi:hypothetical protein